MKLMKNILSAAATAAVALSAAPAGAAGIPVIDPGNIAQTVRVVQNGIQQLQQLKQQVQQVTQMANTIGRDGPMSLANSALRAAGIDFSNPETSPIAQYRAAMPGLLDALPGSSAGSSINISSDLAQQAKTNLQSARQFAVQAFYKPGSATTDEITARRGIREAAMRDSVTSGYAMAVYTKNDLAKVEERMKALSEQIGKSTDLRSDVQGNSAVALAQLQQISVQNQLLAQLLEVQATAAMANDSAAGSPR